MVNNLDEELKNITKILDSATSVLSVSADSINNIMTSEVMASMSDTQRQLIEKSKELVSLDIKNPEEILKKQKELAELMALSRKEEG